jgi:MFS transporter, FSR family, fosmidomycin resistance protein
MSTLSARLSLGFSCVGHTYSHLVAPIFFVVALSLENELGLTHGETVALIILSNVLFGAAAPLAGWLGDRWSSIGMMVFFFFGTGGGMVLTGFADSPMGITAGLAVTGLFASIYHPVGMAWIVRNAVNRGTALGVSGFFGGIGPALAALLAGALTDWISWRAAFVVPGTAMLVTGVAFLALVAGRIVVETKVDRRPQPPALRGDAVRAFTVLAITMICAGLIYQATQAGIPKLFSERLGTAAGDGILGVGALVALVFFFGGTTQILAGYIADRVSIKSVYILCFAFQVPTLLLAGTVGGTLLIIVSMAMVSANWSSSPAENSLVATYAPSRWRGVIYGLKFVLSFAVCGFLGVKLEGVIYDMTGGFTWLFTVLAAVAAVAVAAGLLLPSERRTVPVAAE